MFQNAPLRKSLRQQRRQLSLFEQKQHAIKVLQRLYRFPPLQSAQKVGVYLHAFGEVATDQLIEYCLQHNKAVYLPIVCQMNQQLRWVKISQQQFRSKRFSRHRLGMLEPQTGRGIHVSHLDLLIMPLLACDHAGTRMGMGGGFYDRTLASAPFRPYRLGLAHDFQLTRENLQRNPWDQPLHALITPTKLLRF